MRRRRAALPKPRQGDKRSHESNGTRSSRAEARPGRGDDLDAKSRRSKLRGRPSAPRLGQLAAADMCRRRRDYINKHPNG